MAMGRFVVPTVMGAKNPAGSADHEMAQQHAEPHGGENPDREITVQEGHVLGHRLGRDLI